MANIEDFPDGRTVPKREPLIRTRYWQVLEHLINGAPFEAEDFDTDIITRLCKFSNVALAEAYKLHPSDDPKVLWMEIFHELLGDEYENRAYAVQQEMLPDNVRLFPGVTLGQIAISGETFEPCPALPFDILRQGALRLTVLDQSL